MELLVSHFCFGPNRGSAFICWYFCCLFNDFVAPLLDFTLHISLSPFLFVQTVFHPPHASEWICFLPMCRTFASYPLWIWGWSKHVLLKHWYLCMRLQSVITWVKIWIDTTMKTWKILKITFLGCLFLPCMLLIVNSLSETPSTYCYRSSWTSEPLWYIH